MRQIGWHFPEKNESKLSLVEVQCNRIILVILGMYVVFYFDISLKTVIPAIRVIQFINLFLCKSSSKDIAQRYCPTHIFDKSLGDSSIEIICCYTVTYVKKTNIVYYTSCHTHTHARTLSNTTATYQNEAHTLVWRTVYIFIGIFSHTPLHTCKIIFWRSMLRRLIHIPNETTVPVVNSAFIR